MKIVKINRSGDSCQVNVKAKKGGQLLIPIHMLIRPEEYVAPEADDRQDREEYRDMQKRYNLESNDIIFTPDIVFDWMSAMLGQDVKQFFDPCPGVMVPWDGLEIPWESPAFCNPPFSEAGGGWKFIEKAVAEAKLGKEVILLVNSNKYLMNGKATTLKQS
eukprot:COSAG01_NODE_29391_length_639_cov_0.622222_1_plen_161_part_10